MKTVGITDIVYNELNKYCSASGVKKFIVISTAVREYLRRRK